MKKIIGVSLLQIGIGILIFLGLTNSADAWGYKWDLYKMDSVLVEMLNISYNDPFWTPTIRQDYLQMGIKRTSSLIPISITKSAVSSIPINTSVAKWVAGDVVNFIALQRYEGTDSVYSLIEISPGDVGQKELSTSSPARYYWWVFKGAGDTLSLYIYPPDPDNAVVLTKWLQHGVSSTTYIQQLGCDNILLYAAYKCYLQKSETKIAQMLKQMSDALIFDLKNILENRPINITMKKKVLSK